MVSSRILLNSIVAAHISPLESSCQASDQNDGPCAKPQQNSQWSNGDAGINGWLVVEPYPSEKYEGQLGVWNSQYMEKKVPNHQPDGDSVSILLWFNGM